MARFYSFLIVLLVFVVLLMPTMGLAAGNLIFKGQIVDTANRPVVGAEVYVFNSSNVKRPADFISNRTGSDGYFRVEIPQGHYWTIAILRVNAANFGPLGKDDKYSGEPIEIDAVDKSEVSNDFTVMDLREAARANQKRSETVVKVSGQILNIDGLPARMVYAMADINEKFGDIPLYLSTWTDVDGRYVLFLPKGKYFMGVSKDFPPKNDYRLAEEIDFTQDTDKVDLIMPAESN